MPQIDYDVIFVGRGYSVATYLFTADLDWADKILVIGGPDSWSEIVRGEGVVNHARYVYARTALERKSLEQMPATRPELVTSNARIIRFMQEILRIRGKTVDDKLALVTKIKVKDTLLEQDLTRPSTGEAVFERKQGETTPIYTVTYLEGEAKGKVNALKVVYGGGAGPQRRPSYVMDILGQDARRAEKAMDLDTFVHLYGAAELPIKQPRGTGKTVALVGPNAGIDAALAALNQGFNLFWLVGSDPPFLETKHYEIFVSGKQYVGSAAIDYAKQFLIHYKRDNTDITLEYDAEAEQFSIKIPKKFNPRVSESMPDTDAIAESDAGVQLTQIDFFVYAIGQDPTLTEYIYDINDRSPTPAQTPLRVGPAAALAPILKQGKLWPIYDVNQRYGWSFETVVGLQVPGSHKYNGLEVIGAAAYALASQREPYAEHAYFRQWAGLPDPETIEPPKLKDALLSARAYVDQFKRYGEALILFVSKKAPSVAEAMVAIKDKLGMKTVIAADQLGAVRAQVEALTGFDLRVDITTVWYLASVGQEFNRSAQTCVGLLQKKSDVGPAMAGLGVWARALVDALESTRWLTVLGLLRKAERLLANQRGSQVVEGIHLLLEDKPEGELLSRRLQQLQSWVTDVMACLEKVSARETIDLNGMDRTQLAVVLCAAFPNIPPEDWGDILADIIGGRSTSPWGYSAEDVTRILGGLEMRNSG